MLRYQRFNSLYPKWYSDMGTIFGPWELDVIINTSFFFYYYKLRGCFRYMFVHTYFIEVFIWFRYLIYIWRHNVWCAVSALSVYVYDQERRHHLMACLIITTQIYDFIKFTFYWVVRTVRLLEILIFVLFFN